MHAVQPPRRPARRPGFGAETMRQPAQQNRQPGRVDDLIGVHAAQRNFGGADQIQIRALDAVNLRFGTPRVEPDAFKNRRPRHVGGRHHGEPTIGQKRHRKHLQRHVQTDRVAGQIIKPRTGHPSSRLEVEPTVSLTQFDMIQRRKTKLADRRLSPGQFDRVIFATLGHVIMRPIGKRPNQPVQFRVNRFQLF